MVLWMATVIEIKTATKFLKLKSPISVKNLGRTNRQTETTLYGVTPQLKIGFEKDLS